MINVSSKIVFIIAICIAFGCSTSNNTPVAINFSADSSVIVVTGINPVGLLQLKNNSFTEEDSARWLLVSVNDSLVAGKVSISNDTLVFNPATPFTKGISYLVTTPLNTNFGDAENMLKGKINYRISPQQQLLQR